LTSYDDFAEKTEFLRILWRDRVIAFVEVPEVPDEKISRWLAVWEERLDGPWRKKEEKKPEAEGAEAAAVSEIEKKKEEPLRIQSIEGPKSAGIGDKVIFMVSAFSRSPANDEKKTISWCAKIADKIVKEGKNQGESWEFPIPDAWAGDTVRVYAYVNSPSEKVMVETTIGPHLLFDGKELSWYGADRKKTASWPGVSGEKGIIDPAKEHGPIPDGKWLVKQSEIQTLPEKQVLGMSFAQDGGKGEEWEGGEDTWGKERVQIFALHDVESHGRMRFYIHGGKKAGTGFGIDLTGKVGEFVKKMKEWGKDVVMVVTIGNTHKKSSKISKNMTHKEFVDAVYQEAKIDEASSKVPAAITTAQACLETGYGKSIPTDIKTDIYSYNLFGIKGSGSAGSVTIWTQEFDNVKQKMVKIKDYFAAYNNFHESIKGRSNFLKGNPRYKTLFENSDPAKWAHGLQKCGYATDPDYAAKLISIIKQWDLK
jgi:hypothetical protein